MTKKRNKLTNVEKFKNELDDMKTVYGVDLFVQVTFPSRFTTRIGKLAVWLLTKAKGRLNIVVDDVR